MIRILLIKYKWLGINIQISIRVIIHLRFIQQRKFLHYVSIFFIQNTNVRVINVVFMSTITAIVYGNYGEQNVIVLITLIM